MWLLVWPPTLDPGGIFCGTGHRGLWCANSHEWLPAPNPGDWVQPKPRVAQRVQGKNPMGFRVYRQVFGEMPQHAPRRGLRGPTRLLGLEGNSLGGGRPVR
jgi:hypothetical protein